MTKPQETTPASRDQAATGSMRSNIAMLVFGLMTLFYLVAIDHEEWFHMRPISGVTTSRATSPAPTTKAICDFVSPRDASQTGKYGPCTP